MSNKEFRETLGCFVTGVTVVTAIDNSISLGVTANSFSSVSLEPPLVSWSISKHSQKHYIMTTVKNYAINVLSNKQKGIAINFSKSQEPFLGLDHRFSKVGVPIINQSVATFECELRTVYDGGDHSIILGLVTSFSKSNLDPLMFFKGNFS